MFETNPDTCFVHALCPPTSTPLSPFIFHPHPGPHPILTQSRSPPSSIQNPSTPSLAPLHLPSTPPSTPNPHPVSLPSVFHPHPSTPSLAPLPHPILTQSCSAPHPVSPPSVFHPNPRPHRFTPSLAPLFHPLPRPHPSTPSLAPLRLPSTPHPHASTPSFAPLHLPSTPRTLHSRDQWSCRRASDHQVGCRAPSRRAPSRHFQSELRPGTKRSRSGCLFCVARPESLRKRKNS